MHILSDKYNTSLEKAKEGVILVQEGMETLSSKIEELNQL